MPNLPVREMVLYKHGVGFFVRQGEIAGEHIQLTFRKDEINDVLKSLAVFDQAGGQVLGIHYQTPMDKAARLASSSIRLDENTSLSDLIRDLRGRECEIGYEITVGTPESIRGRIIGMNEAKRDADLATVSLLTPQRVQVLPLDAIRSIQIADEQSAHDLTYFLDTSMAEDDRRVVTVRLSAGEHDLAVYYVAPSPTWRVSYRLVAESDENGSTGTALLQGWGLFDNRLEEDLENVRVTLVAGQPISFIYELYASRIPHRPTVEDESRVAPGPIEFAGGAMPEADYLSADMDDEITYGAAPRRMSRRLAGRAMAQSAPASAPKMAKASIAESAQVQAESKETGETFQYLVNTPVTVKRGESALVPIIGKEIKYERELLYNGMKLPDHPIASLRFPNATGLTLERGPVTVVEDGDYKGEAVIPFTKEDTQVYTPYAVELGIKVTEHTRNHNHTYGLYIDGNQLVEQIYQSYVTTYTIDNTTSKPQRVTIEAGIYAPNELFDTRSPDVETTNERRWHVPVAAKSKAEFVRQERRKTYQRSAIINLGYQRLAQYLKDKWIDQELHGRLKAILDLMTEKAQAMDTMLKLGKEREKIYKQQEQLRANLGALQPTGQEATLRNRLLKQLEESQDRLDDIENQIRAAQQFETDAEQKINELIAALGD